MADEDKRAMWVVDPFGEATVSLEILFMDDPLITLNRVDGPSIVMSLEEAKHLLKLLPLAIQT